MKFLEEIRMYFWLRKTIPSDCQWRLFEELIFYPEELRKRYEKEAKFQEKIDSRWK